jgi:two-component system chemotaxis response regulator CheY
MKVLIVDDSKAMRMIVMRTLRQAGFDASVTEAVDGIDALQKARAGSFDVVLSDWNMPQLDGLGLLKALRDNGDFTRFGFITSESNPDMTTLAVEAGAAFVITKPFNEDTVREALGERVG